MQFIYILIKFRQGIRLLFDLVKGIIKLEKEIMNTIYLHKN
ncbi:MAG: hypothetical protein K0S76_1038 [Herbinix sp.]|jgi:hypothetical protein|nr:hypothetical protein [Herbinix sp.]